VALRNRDRNALKARALTASAVRIDLGSKAQAVKLRNLRQSWQEEAWSYRDAIPEIGYAMRFKATAVSRMRLYAAMWVDGEDQPVPLDENPAGLPAGLADAAARALEDLAPGRMGHANLLRSLNENVEVAGECFLLGQDDPDTGEQTFAIRSIDELVVDAEGHYMLRALPPSNGATAGGVPIAANSYVARMWAPHPRFSELADSPMRSLLESGEELLLLSRSIRAATRSRLANGGILGIASELSFASTTAGGDDDDPEADPFMANLVEAMITPISDEASASAVIPIVVRGPADVLEKGIIYKPLIRPADDRAAADRAELIGRIANGLDIPREILTGVADLNHWTAWQVDDSTFRYHIEPAVLRDVNSLTVGYFRPRLLADGGGYSREDVARLVIWYDPTDLVTHPDRTADAINMFDRDAISLASLRDAGGWDDSDAPGEDEFVVRMLSKVRTFPDNVLEAIMHRAAPNLLIPPTSTDPGIGPGTSAPPVIAAPAVKPAPAVEGPPASQPPADSAPPAVTSAVAVRGPVDAARSAKLARIDASLRDRMLTAADQTMHRALERAGNRAKGKAPNAIKASLSGVDPARICAELGRTVVASYGLTEHHLLEGEFATLKDRFHSWVSTANKAVLSTAVSMIGGKLEDAAIKAAADKQESATSSAWQWLLNALMARAEKLLYDPTDVAGDKEQTTSGSSLVPVGIIRGAIAIAGGYADVGHGITDEGLPVDHQAPLGGIGSGPIITTVLTRGGADIDHYLWNHGIAEHPFEPHLALDGTEFTRFTDTRLANKDSAWVGNQFFFPGDHDGCSCDVQLMWSGPAADGYGLAASADAV
jgi:hypothetical protein